MSKLTAQVPVPSEPLTAYYRPSVPDLLVRLDVTYLPPGFFAESASGERRSLAGDAAFRFRGPHAK